MSTLTLYVYLLCIGAIMAPLNTVASLWMPRNPGLAIGIVSAGGAFGRGVVSFVARHLILLGGWREAYFAMALLHLAIMLRLAFAIAPSRKCPQAGSTLAS